MHLPSDPPPPAKSPRRLLRMGHVSGVAVRVLLCAWVGCVATVSMGVFAVSVNRVAWSPQLKSNFRAEFELEREAAEIAAAISREPAIARKLKSHRHVDVTEGFDPVSLSISSDLDRRVAELTDGHTRRSALWMVSINKLRAVDEYIQELKQLRHIHTLSIKFDDWTVESSNNVRRLPPADNLVLIVELDETKPFREPPYHLLDGLPFTCVAIRSVPLTKSISRTLPSFPLLDNLSLDDCKAGIADEVWADLPQCRRLSTVTIRSVDVTDSGMKFIAQIPSLKRLFVSNVNLRNRRGLSLLPASLELDILGISDCPYFGDLSLSELAVDPIELYISETSVGFVRWGRDWLLSRKRLKRVNLSGQQFITSDVDQLNALGGPQINFATSCW
jgi:hypothetical protein